MTAPRAGIPVASLELVPARAASSTSWIAGDHVVVRGRRWTIAGVTRSADCAALRLREVGTDRLQSILTPFDRPRAVDARRTPRVVRPRRWLHELDRTLVNVHPFGGLTAAARTGIRLMPYQLEPALAVMRDGATRVLVADEVGLGKTIQAGLLLHELSARTDACRALVLVPAGLRDQWRHELSGHFGLTAIAADAAWLRSTAADRPADVNPWSLPGVYVSSHDFVKRPEVLRPLEAVAWDLIVIDEAHAVTSGTDRRAAIHGLARRSRRVMLLTATPHAGDPIEFDALCRIGLADAGEEPARLFRRSRSEVDDGRPRKSLVLPVVPSDAERRMHHLLDRYSRLVWKEAHARGDDRARLASIVLRKRALSSAGSLAASAHRRLELLSAAATTEAWQLALPIADDEDPLEDDEPWSALAAPGLSDPKRERRWLSAIVEAARMAARAETKTRFLLRLVARLREPAIIFTEYRDTLARLERQLVATRRSLVLLHGGMSAADRSRAQRTFNDAGGVLLATDAAAEGLNLHHQCRIVIHYELPWNPSRLQQRAGRVDRLGQTRRVHEIVLVAADTAERLVLAPLAARIARARVMGGATGLMDALTESRVAEIVMSGDPFTASESTPELLNIGASESERWRVVGVGPHDKLRKDAALLEAARLQHHRRLLARSPSRALAELDRPAISIMRSERLPPGLFLLYVLSASTAAGHRLHAEPVLFRVDLRAEPVDPPSPERLRQFVASLTAQPDTDLTSLVDHVADQMLDTVGALHHRVRDRLMRREHAIAGARVSAARQLVQAGLFDRRSLNEAAARARANNAAREETTERLTALSDATSLRADSELIAALLVRSRRRAR